MINPEWAGIPAAVLVLISYLFRDQIKLRIINTFACVAFVAYGILIGISSDWTAGYSTLVLNVLCVGVHVFYLVKFVREKKRAKSAPDTDAAVPDSPATPDENA